MISKSMVGRFGIWRNSIQLEVFVAGELQFFFCEHFEGLRKEILEAELRRCSVP